MLEAHNKIIPRGDIEKTGLQKVVDKVRLFGRPKELDLEIARNILQLVVDTDENTIDPSARLDKLGPYSMKVVRQALKTVAFDVFYAHEGGISRIEDFLLDLYATGGICCGSDYHFSKVTDKGPIKASIISFDGKQPSNVEISLRTHSNDCLIESKMPVVKPKTNLQRFTAGVYTDNRPEYKTMVLPDGEFQMDEYRKSWLGFRWLSNTLLTWDSGFKLPEELGPKLPQLGPSVNSSLSSSFTKTLLY